MKRIIYLLAIIALVLASCSPAPSNLPFLGVFLKSGKEYQPLDKFNGPPKGEINLVINTAAPEIVVWLENLDPQNFVLLSYEDDGIVKTQVAYNLRPVKEDIYELLIGDLPAPDDYCFVLVNSSTEITNMAHWCFRYSTESGNNNPVTQSPQPSSTSTSPISLVNESLIPITPENANQVQEIARMGKGSVNIPKLVPLEIGKFRHFELHIDIATSHAMPHEVELH